MKRIKLLFFLLVLVLSQHLVYAQCPNPPSYNDPASQDGILELMNIPCAWTITNGDPSITVAVFDQYLDNGHDDLVGKVVEIVGNCDPAQADYHHGILSFGAIAGIRNNGICISGSGGETTVAGWCECANNQTLLDAMNHGYKIISVSCWYGGITRQTMETLTDNGVTVLLAGLNQHHEADDPNGYHSVPGVIHMGRARQNGTFWTYLSNDPGPNMNMDVLAVTDGLWRIADANTCELSGPGTSIGTPLVAGVVALMQSVNPCLFPGDIEEILVQTAAPANDPATRAGVIDAFAAVQMAQNFQGFDETWSGTDDIQNAQVSGDLTIESGSDITLLGRLKTGSNSIVTIEAGAKLTILGRVEMGEAAHFIVKRGAELIVDGGIITTGECADQWEGISIEGNSDLNQQQPGDVMDVNKNGVVFLKDATLENAHTFIDMASKHISWPQVKEYWGGHVTAINTTFTNTNEFTNYSRVAAFMQYFKEERSRFTDCTISNVAAGMTHWSNYGTTYDHCTFDTYQQHALLTYDAKINVINGNTFDNGNHTEFNQAAIDLYQTYPIPTGSIIGDNDGLVNQFFGGYHSLFSEGGNPIQNPIEVKNNIFTGGQYNIRFDGVSRHIIEENDMIAPVFGTTIVSNGDLYNTLRDNQFSNNDVGLFTFYDNQHFDFLSNCFDFSAVRDVRIHGGPILDNIGNSDVAASNIFSGALWARWITLSGNAPGFIYHILIGTPSIDRTVPVFSVGNGFNEFDALEFDNDLCGSVTSPGPININTNDCVLPNTKEELLLFISTLEMQLANLEIQLGQVIGQTTQWYQIRYSITEIEKCLQQAKIKLIWLHGKLAEYPVLETKFQNDDFLYKTYVYGTMLYNEDYTTARNYLTTMGAMLEDEVDFIITQNINLNRLEAYNYEWSSSELNTLYTIGNKTYPMSAYARSLYRYATGDKIELDLPYAVEDKTAKAKFSIPAQKPGFQIAPNPTTGFLKIKHNLDKAANLSIYNSMGNLILMEIMDAGNHKTTLDITTQTTGLYFVIIRDEQTDELLYSKRIVLTH